MKSLRESLPESPPAVHSDQRSVGGRHRPIHDPALAEVLERRQRGDVAAISFGATAAIWIVLYLTCMPAVAAPPALVAGLVLLCLLAAGVVSGRSTEGSMGRSVVRGIGQGVVITAINLLIIASFGSDSAAAASGSAEAAAAADPEFVGGDRMAELVNAVLPWIGGFLIASTVLGGFGAALGALARPQRERAINWTFRFAMIIAFITLMLLKAGGIVTGLEAGMAVPDWLTTFGYPMMFYPLEQMRQDGGVFAEHFHRLWGLLVGLGMITLVLHLFRTDVRSWVRWTATGLLLLVIVQGVLGGTRVTENNLELAVAHGVVGQLIFAGIVCLAMWNATAWFTLPGSELAPARDDEPSRQQASHGQLDRRLACWLFGLLIVQLILGALFRHYQSDPAVPAALLHGVLGLHILGAIFVLGLTLVAGSRAWGLFADLRPIWRTGIALLIIVSLQFVLGWFAFSVVPLNGRAAGAEIPLVEVLITSAHQVVGSLLLASAAALLVWTSHLLPAPPREERVSAFENTAH